jgi:hypothetical protein
MISEPAQTVIAEQGQYHDSDSYKPDSVSDSNQMGDVRLKQSSVVDFQSPNDDREGE